VEKSLKMGTKILTGRNQEFAIVSKTIKILANKS
jgi:hypothetical protein